MNDYHRPRLFLSEKGEKILSGANGIPYILSLDIKD
jgi:hypothetical protein